MRSLLSFGDQAGTIPDMYGARLRDALPRVEERIARARDRSGRAGEVTLVAVTKGHPPDAVRAAAAAGIRDCGENRAAELVHKRAELGNPVRWHLIGHLQRNKVRTVIGQFDLIHSVDSVRLARELSGEAERAGLDLEALIQVNVSGEETKTGFDLDSALDAIAEVVLLPRLHVRGLMTMAPFTEDEAVLRRTFQRTRALFDTCGRDVPGFIARDLSMGMSNDFDMAVEEGSTMVRLGTVLFGERTP